MSTKAKSVIMLVLCVASVFSISAGVFTPGICLEELVLMLVNTASAGVEFLLPNGYFSAETAVADAFLANSIPGETIEFESLYGVLVHIDELTVRDFNVLLTRAGHPTITDINHLRSTLSEMGAEISENNEYALFRAQDYPLCNDTTPKPPQPPALESDGWTYIRKGIEYYRLPLALFDSSQQRILEEFGFSKPSDNWQIKPLEVTITFMFILLIVAVGNRQRRQIMAR